ncbi:MAG: Spy/CpxP family protein refolding chaperone [Gracilimonas sp.]|nr:Spy/CpxP family protein refolding chaperone [Gracilimonas sp.]
MKTITHIFPVLFLLFAFSASVFAQPANNRPNRPGFNQGPCAQMSDAQNNPRHQRMITMLDLNEQQASAIETIHTNGQKVMVQLRANLQTKRSQLNALAVSDDYDQSEATKIAEEIGEIHTQMLTMRMSHQQQIRSLLTEEQRAKFDTFHLNRGGQGQKGNRPMRPRNR